MTSNGWVEGDGYWLTEGAADYLRMNERAIVDRDGLMEKAQAAAYVDGRVDGRGWCVVCRNDLEVGRRAGAGGLWASGPLPADLAGLGLEEDADEDG